MFSIIGGGTGQRYSRAEWKKHRPELEDLYVKSNWSLPAIMDHMKTKRHFDASAEMYRSHFRQWGFRKNKRHAGPGAAQWRVRQSGGLVGGLGTVNPKSRNLPGDADDENATDPACQSNNPESPPSGYSSPDSDVQSSMVSSKTNPSSPFAVTDDIGDENQHSSNLQNHAQTRIVIRGSTPHQQIVRTQNHHRTQEFLEPAEDGLRKRRASQVYAPAKSLKPPKTLRYYEDALVMVRDWFDGCSSLDPDWIVRRFSNPQPNWRAVPLFPAFVNLDGGSTYTALRQMKKACSMIETSQEPLDLSYLIDVVSTPWVFGNYPCQPSLNSSRRRSSFNVYLKHLRDFATLRVGPGYPITRLTAYLRDVDSLTQLCFNICCIVNNMLMETLGPSHVATLRMRRRVARLPLYMHRRPDMDAAEYSLNRILDDYIQQLGEDHLEVLNTRRDIAMVLHAKGDWEGIQRHYKSSIDQLLSDAPRLALGGSPADVTSQSSQQSPEQNLPLSRTQIMSHDLAHSAPIIAAAQEALGNYNAAETTLRRALDISHTIMSSMRSASSDPGSPTSLPSPSPPPSQSTSTSTSTSRSTSMTTFGPAAATPASLTFNIWSMTALELTRRLAQFLTRRRSEEEARPFYNVVEETEREAEREWNIDDGEGG